MPDSAAYMTATAVMSALAAAGNVVLFSSQLPLVWRLHSVDKDASNYDPLPSLTLLFAMSLWSGYAVWVLPTVQVFVANFSGVVLPLFYLSVFATYSKPLPRLRLVAATLAIETAAWLICWGIYTSGRADAVTMGGAITCAVNCTFFLSPLRKLHEAVTTRDLSRVPVLLSAVQFFQGLTWIIAAVLLRDDFILGINCAGFFFACLQLSVIAYIRLKGPFPALPLAVLEGTEAAGAAGPVVAAEEPKKDFAASPSSPSVLPQGEESAMAEPEVQAAADAGDVIAVISVVEPRRPSRRSSAAAAAALE